MSFFFFNDTATTEIYTLSLHDALPICSPRVAPPAPSRQGRPEAPLRSARIPSLPRRPRRNPRVRNPVAPPALGRGRRRSEEHTSELQSRQYLVCRLLLEKKKKLKHYHL